MNNIWTLSKQQKERRKHRYSKGGVTNKISIINASCNHKMENLNA